MKQKIQKNDIGKRRRTGKGQKAAALGILVLMTAGILSGGCGMKTGDSQKKVREKQEEESREYSKSDAFQAEREELVIWSYFETHAQRDGLDRLVRNFNQSQNKYTVSWEYEPMTSFNNKLSSAFAEESLPDMAILDNPDMPMMIQMGMFEDLTDIVEAWNLEETYYQPLLQTVSYDGEYYGVPFDCNNTALIYNRSMLEEAGLEPPETWEELRRAAATLTTDDCAGFLMCGMEGEQGAFQILSWILAAGENTSSIGGEKTEAAFTFLAELLGDGSLPERCINLSQTDVSREFAAGKAAIMQNGPWAFPQLDESGIDYGVIRIPSPESEKDSGYSGAVAGGENIGILKGKNKEGSLEFLRFCMETEELLQFCRESNVLPVKIEDAKKLIENEERMQVFEEQMYHAVTRTAIPHWSSQISGRLTDGLFSLVAHEKTPEEVTELFR